MTPYYIRNPTPFFGFQGILSLEPETNETQICDICGRKRKCGWYTPIVEDAKITGMDVCRSCAAVYRVKAVCPKCGSAMTRSMIKGVYVCLDCEIEMKVEE